jgi:hypothetical protein
MAVINFLLPALSGVDQLYYHCFRFFSYSEISFVLKSAIILKSGRLSLTGGKLRISVNLSNVIQGALPQANYINRLFRHSNCSHK